MSFFIANRLTCFLCRRTIESRVDAAHLPYAHPEDVGDLARYGRSWVHRSCWNEASLREKWAGSALRLLVSDPDSFAISDIAARSSGYSVLLRDPMHAIEIDIPIDKVSEFIQANEHGGEVTSQATKWAFELANGVVTLTMTFNGELVERLQHTPGRWSKILTAVLENGRFSG